jgi:hypothetical protein
LQKVTDLQAFTGKHLQSFEDFLKQGHYSQSCITDLPEEEAIVATFMKYWGDDHDLRKEGRETVTLTEE